MTITALPTPPSRDDPSTFATRADAFLGALPTFATEANALASAVNADEIAAAASATEAEASANAAAASANVTKWVSGTTYTEGANVWSPITYLTYRRKTTGAGTTDPSADSTNWAQVSGTGDVTVAGNNAFTGANNFHNATGQTFGTATSSQDGIILAGRNGGTSSYRVTVQPTTLSANRTLTLPNVTDTVATIGTAQTFTATQTVRAAPTQDGVALAGRAGGTSSYAVTITPTTLSASRTVTLPNADINFTTGLGVANGGTGATTLTANNVILGNGTSAVQFVAPGANGNVLTSDGTTWSSTAPAAGLLGQTNSGSPFETSLGYQAGNVNTGTSNTFIGYQAGVANTVGASNVALGARALDANTTGTNNVALGVDALDSNTTGSSNIAIGAGALATNTIGTSNIGIGASCLSQSTNSNNVAIGLSSMYALTTGANNTAIGTQAADSLTTGTGNVIIGSSADASAAGGVDQIVIGYGVTGQANTNVTIGNSSGKIYNAYTVNATWTQTSDGTMKNIIGPDTLGLSFIKRLNPIKFTWKPQNELPIDHPYYKEINGRDTNVVVHGFVAQEVKAALDAEGCTTFNGWDQGSDGIQAISREMFVSPLVKAVQELSEQIEILKEEIVLLKASS